MPASERLVAAVDLGGTKLLAATARLAGDRVEVVHRLEVPAPTTDDDVVRSIGDAIEGVADGAVLDGVGLGVPGFVGRDRIARQAPNLRHLVGVDVATPIERRFGVPCNVDNDGNCAARAAAVLDAPGHPVVIAVTLGTGIGGGMVIDGTVLRGVRGFASEPGHLIVDPRGLECPCGARGCWETVASGTGLARVARRMAAAIPEVSLGAGALRDSREITRLAREGHPGARRALHEWSGWVAIGLVTLINIFDPSAIVLSGGIVAEGEGLIVPIRRAVDAIGGASSGREVDIGISSVGVDAGVVGAAILAGEPPLGR